jgi:hypothetical protein
MSFLATVRHYFTKKNKQSKKKQPTAAPAPIATPKPKTRKSRRYHGEIGVLIDAGVLSDPELLSQGFPIYPLDDSDPDILETNMIHSLDELKEDAPYVTDKGTRLCRRREEVTLAGKISIPVPTEDYQPTYVMRGYLDPESLIFAVENFTKLKMPNGLMFYRNCSNAGKVFFDFKLLEPNEIYTWEKNRIILQRVDAESSLIHFTFGHDLQPTIRRLASSNFNQLHTETFSSPPRAPSRSALNGAPPPPPPPMAGAPPPPPPPPGARLAGTPPGNKKKLRALHWSAISKDKINEKSFWYGLQNKSSPQNSPNRLQINENELESIFSISPVKVAGRNDVNRTPTKRQTIHSLLDLRRTNNTSILLSRFKMSTNDIKTALVECNTEVLSLENLISLSYMFPLSDTERKDLVSYRGDKSQLSVADKFYLETMSVPRVENRIQLLLFKYQFATTIDFLRLNIKSLAKASDEIKNSSRFRDILKTIWSLGNVLNRGTSLSSKAFKFDTLTKLGDTKGKDGKVSVLDYLIDLLNKQKPELLKFEEEIPNLDAASKLAPECIAEELSKIETTLRLIQAELGYYETKLSGDKENASVNIVINTPDEGGAQFIKVMKPFLDEANKIFNAIQSEYKQALLRYSEALSFYAEEVDTKPHQFFAHVTNFASTIRKASLKKSQLQAASLVATN